MDNLYEFYEDLVNTAKRLSFQVERIGPDRVNVIGPLGMLTYVRKSDGWSKI